VALRQAFDKLKEGEGAFQERAQALSDGCESDYVREMVNFITGDSDRGFLTPK